MRGPFFEQLHAEVMALGGYHNAHLHLCRAGTWEDTKLSMAEAADSHLSISAKHGLIPLIHSTQAFDRKRYAERMRRHLDWMIDAGTTKADTLVDVAADTKGAELFEVMETLRGEYAPALTLRLGTYCPLGFRDDMPERWRLVEELANSADFIGALPERDDRRMYPEHIGFEESVGRVLDLSLRTGKSVHMHVDQKNDPAEDACEVVLSAIERTEEAWSEDEPQVWLIHAISPSAYLESRFRALLARMSAASVGVICCPSAAISMRQLRCVESPVHNSIARVLDFLAEGIPVRVASDNINDITSPAGTTDLLDEIFVLCNVIRFYDIPILARLAAGVDLSEVQVEMIRRHLEIDRAECERSMRFTRSRMIIAAAATGYGR